MEILVLTKIEKGEVGACFKIAVNNTSKYDEGISKEVILARNKWCVF